MTSTWHLAWTGLAVLLASLLTACGDDGEGNEDTLLTGFSGLVILIVVAWLIVRALRKRG